MGGMRTTAIVLLFFSACTPDSSVPLPAVPAAPPLGHLLEQVRAHEKRFAHMSPTALPDVPEAWQLRSRGLRGLFEDDGTVHVVDQGAPELLWRLRLNAGPVRDQHVEPGRLTWQHDGFD